MLELKNDRLVFRFPEVHPSAVFTVTLQRTLRIPDDGKQYPLPPGLGAFPVRHVDDFASRIPQKWTGRGGVMVPLYQSEAMWLHFDCGFAPEHHTHYPFAVKVATGKCSAVTGKKWSKKLREKDYLVCPEQPWLDGYVVEDGTVRQFVAAPLGLGVTAEEQLTGKAEFGGLQIEVIPMALEHFSKKYEKRQLIAPRGVLRSKSSLSIQGLGGPFQGGHGIPGVYSSTLTDSRGVVKASAGVIGSVNMTCDSADAILESRGMDVPGAKLDMGLAPGGRMQQQIFQDPHGLDVWHKTEKARCFIHMANSLGWEHVTGQRPQTVPMTAATYSRHGLPWFELYEEGAAAHGGTEKTKSLKSVAQISAEKCIPVLPENQSVQPKNKVVLKSKDAVRDGVWK